MRMCAHVVKTITFCSKITFIIVKEIILSYFKEIF